MLGAFQLKTGYAELITLLLLLSFAVTFQFILHRWQKNAVLRLILREGCVVYDFLVRSVRVE